MQILSRVETKIFVFHFCENHFRKYRLTTDLCMDLYRDKIKRNTQNKTKNIFIFLES